MRKEKVIIDEYYHIYNRGVNKQTLFHDRSDYVRFLFMMLYFQSSKTFSNIRRYVIFYLKNNIFNIALSDIQKIISDQHIGIISFCIMPNHFHIIIKGIKKDGATSYMHRVLGGYSRYYNKKYGTSGHLFQGAYKIVHIENNIQLLYLSAYIHRNPRSLLGWENKELKYEWSSYQDYVKEGRFGRLLTQTIILDQFSSKKDYQKFVESSPAKLK